MTAPATPDPVSPPADRLDSWKEIAAYLKRGVRTVQRWEQSDGLPVHRLGSERTGSVFAYKSELDGWWQARAGSGTLSAPEPPEVQPRPFSTVAAVVGLLLITTAAGAWLWTRRAPADHPPMNRPLPLTFDHGSELDPSFSPDGRQVAYLAVTEGRGALLFVKTIGSDQNRQLTLEPSSIAKPAWSPDGRIIAFLRRNPEVQHEWRIVIAQAAGGGVEVYLPTAVSNPGTLTWTPDGESLIVSHGSPVALHLLSVRTGSLRQLTYPATGVMDIQARLSPDLRNLAFTRFSLDRPRVYELALGPGYSPSPEGPHQFSSRQAWAMFPVYTADGKEIIYSTGPWFEAASLVRQARTPGAPPRPILPGWEQQLTPALSPDGKRLAVALRRASRVDLWRKPLADPAAPAERLISSSARMDLNPAYSPDGRAIAFHSTRSGFSDIWIANADGSNPTQLTHTDAPITATPRWSPDGKWLAFESHPGGNADVFLIAADGTGPARQLTDSPEVDAIPSWSHDGKFIYFTSFRTGRYEIWKIPARRSGEPVQVTRDGGFASIESADGKYLYFTNRRTGGALFRQRLPDGAPEKLIDLVHDLFFALGPSGRIYYASGRQEFSVWNPVTGKSAPLFVTPERANIGIAVSPDERYLLYTQSSDEGSDLYWIENFR